MLGTARASQYAGWWANRTPQVTFTASGALGYNNKQTPSYSLLVNNFDLNYSIMETGDFDLTGYSSLSGFNNKKLTQVYTFKLEWPAPPLPPGDFVSANFFNEVKQGGTIYYLNTSIGVDNTGFYVQTPQGNTVRPILDYTIINTAWATLVISCSDTVTDFQNWSGTQTTGDVYVRTCLFDTVTGQLLGKVDERKNSVSLPNISAMANTVPANNSEASDGYFPGGFGSGTNPDLYEFRLSNHWCSFGTMFDPISETDTSYRTTRPSAVIGQAKAWLNIQLTDYEFVAGSPDEYYVVVSGQDLFSQADDRVIKNNGYAGSQWTDAYSDTDITTDQG